MRAEGSRWRPRVRGPTFWGRRGSEVPRRELAALLTLLWNTPDPKGLQKAF